MSLVLFVENRFVCEMFAFVFLVVSKLKEVGILLRAGGTHPVF